ncbi:unnamed protein product, partial [marine sediment metagenome]
RCPRKYGVFSYMHIKDVSESLAAAMRARRQASP